MAIKVYDFSNNMILKNPSAISCLRILLTLSNLAKFSYHANSYRTEHN